MLIGFLKIMGAALLLTGWQAHASAWLGLSFKPTAEGISVVAVHPQSGAAQAGILPNDLILSIAGVPAANPAALRKAVSKAKIGDQLNLVVRRNDKQLAVKVPLLARPDDLRKFTGSLLGSKAKSFGSNFYANAEQRQKAPKATLLDFWATWCGPCRVTLPHLAQLYNKYRSKNFEVIGVSSEALPVLQQFQTHHYSPYPLYRDSDLSLSREYGIRAVPTLILLDSAGYIHRVWTGSPSPAELEAAILGVMGK